MTHHPHPIDPARAVRRARRAVFAGALVIASGVPLVAYAGAEPAAPTDRVTSPVGAVAAPASTSATRLRHGVIEAPAPPPPRAVAPVDPVMAVLLDTYEWDERGARVAALQRLLDVSPDGWYGIQTRRAHVGVLDYFGLPTTGVPAAVLPPGPEPAKWAALRQCESGGDYSITSRSGKYRGAYQFDRSTWNSVAGRHAPELVGVDPAAAAPADQDAMALALYSERGARPWPHCGRHLR